MGTNKVQNYLINGEGSPVKNTKKLFQWTFIVLKYSIRNRQKTILAPLNVGKRVGNIIKWNEIFFF